MSLRITSIGFPWSPPAKSNSLIPAGTGQDAANQIKRIAAEHDVDRHRLIFLEVFLFMNVGVLARADIDSGGVLILQT